jgi:lipopolysaccharide export system permease protein
MSLLDRYIFKELLLPFIAGIVAFTFILSGSTVLFNLVSEVVKYNIPLGHFAQLFIYKLPVIISLALPMSVLLATLLAFGRMGNDLEILAFRAGGISMLRLIVPILIFGFLVSLSTVLFNEQVVPKASKSAEDLFRSYRDSEAPTIKQNINFTEYDEDDSPLRIINVASIDEGLMQNITVTEFETGQLVRLIRANTGRWLNTGGWEFYDGIMHNFHINDVKRVTVIQFKKEFINIKINPLDLDNRTRKSEEMTRAELRKEIQIRHNTGRDPIKFVMDYHMKISLAFASLIYAILGASIGLRPHRSSSAMGLGISLLIIFFYILLFSIGMGLGLSHAIPPLVAAWFPNIIAGGAGLLLLSKVLKE